MVSRTPEYWIDLANLDGVCRGRSETGWEKDEEEMRVIYTAEAADDYRVSITFAAKCADARPFFSCSFYFCFLRWDVRCSAFNVFFFSRRFVFLLFVFRPACMFFL